MPPARATRDRIIETATRLFADQGIRATTVAQIEAQVGLRPGSGGLHRHFATKNDLVRAVLDAQLTQAERDVEAALRLGPTDPDDPVGSLTQLGRLMLDHANAHREIALIMLRESATLPPDVLDEHHRRNFDITYSTVAASLRNHDERLRGALGLDPDALAYLLLAPLIYFRLIEWAMGEPILELDDDRLVDTWARIFGPIIGEIAHDQL